jgi:hypothetical protein
MSELTTELRKKSCQIGYIEKIAKYNPNYRRSSVVSKSNKYDDAYIPGTSKMMGFDSRMEKVLSSNNK